MHFGSSLCHLFSMLMYADICSGWLEHQDSCMHQRMVNECPLDSSAPSPSELSCSKIELKREKASLHRHIYTQIYAHAYIYLFAMPGGLSGFEESQSLDFGSEYS